MSPRLKNIQSVPILILPQTVHNYKRNYIKNLVILVKIPPEHMMSAYTFQMKSLNKKLH